MTKRKCQPTEPETVPTTEPEPAPAPAPDPLASLAPGMRFVAKYVAVEIMINEMRADIAAIKASLATAKTAYSERAISLCNALEKATVTVEERRKHSDQLKK